MHMSHITIILSSTKHSSKAINHGNHITIQPINNNSCQFLVSQSSILLAKNRNHLISIINPQSISYQNLNISIQFTIHSLKQQSIKIILQTNQAITIHIHHKSSYQILFSLQKPP